jgi:hypothetical protein
VFFLKSRAPNYEPPEGICEEEETAGQAVIERKMFLIGKNHLTDGGVDKYFELPSE